MSEKKDPKKIRPRRKDMDKWTKVPNEVFDDIMSELSGTQFKIYCAIVRKTYGYKKEIIDNQVYYKIKDAISTSQFE